MVRKTHQVETRLVAEYLKDRYSQYPFISGCPLGVVSEDLLKTVGYAKGLRMQRPNRPEVDALVIHPKYLIMIEGKVWHLVDGLAKLPFYKSLVPATPELKDYAGRDVLMEFVAPWSNPNVEMMAAQAGIHYQIFKPAWIDEVAQRVQLYDTREYRLERESKLRARELLGLE